MPTIDTISPTTNEITQALKSLAKKHADLMRVKRIGTTKGQRPIWMAQLTDSRIDDKDKQRAFIAGGRHGNEESGRAQAMATIEWLLSKSGQSILRKQIVTVIPCANPDGTAEDIYKNTDGVNPWYDIEHKTIAAEGQSFIKALKNNEPDLFIDLHAKGHCGHSFDMVLHPKQRVYTEDFYIIWELMQQMAEAGEAATNIPHEIHSMEWPGWDGRGPGIILYERYKSIAVLTETSEHNSVTLPLKSRSKAGLERIKAALALGQKHYPKVPYPGYPNHLVGASFNLGIVAIGKDASTRRKNRIAIWEQMDHFAKLNRQIPEEEYYKVCHLEYHGETLKHACGIQIQVRGKCRLKNLHLDGKPVDQSKNSLFKRWTSDRATYILVPIPLLKKGTYEIIAEFSKT